MTYHDKCSRLIENNHIYPKKLAILSKSITAVLADLSTFSL